LSGRREGGAEEEVVVGQIRSVIRMDDTRTMKEKNKENSEKIKVNRQMPYLVGNIVEVRFHLY